MKLRKRISLVLLSAPILLLWIIIPAVIGLIWDGWETRGQIGDLFGAVGALFAGLALAGVLYTVILQREQVETQRQELDLAIDELRRSFEAQARSYVLAAEQWRYQVLTARLQALSALLNHRMLNEGKNVFADAVDAFAGATAKHYAKEIEQILAELRSAAVPATPAPH